jgi:hypothetical protein
VDLYAPLFIYMYVFLCIKNSPNARCASNTHKIWKQELDYLELEILTAVVTKCTISWDKTPCRPLKVNQRFGWIGRLHFQSGRISREWKQVVSLPPAFTFISWYTYIFTLKMEAVYSPETSFDFQQTTWRYIPEDYTLQELDRWYKMWSVHYLDQLFNVYVIIIDCQAFSNKYCVTKHRH